MLTIVCLKRKWILDYVAGLTFKQFIYSNLSRSNRNYSSVTVFAKIYIWKYLNFVNF